MTPTQGDDAERLAAIEIRLRRYRQSMAEGQTVLPLATWGEMEFLLAQLREARAALARYETQDGQPY
jgi:hypothetical protein